MGKGFTLIELLIAMAIIGILTVVGLTSYTFSLQKSRDTVRKQDLALISKAIIAWAGDFGGYPDDDGSGKMKACDPGGSGVFSACSWGVAMVAFTNGGSQLYLSKIPADPQSTVYYYYKKTDAGFSLFSVLENVNDSQYKSDAGEVDFGAGVITCGTNKTCNYQITESGVK